MLPTSVPGSDADLVWIWHFSLARKLSGLLLEWGNSGQQFFLLKKPRLGTIYKTQFKGSDWTVLENVC